MGKKRELIIAINEFNKKALFAEVKLDPEKISLNKLKFKAQNIRQKLKGYKIEYKVLSLEEM